MQLNTRVIIVGTACSAIKAEALLPVLQRICDKYNINTPRRIAGFLANVGVESGGFNANVENLSYSASRMASVWPSRYAVDPKADVKVPNALATRLAFNPVALGNNVYANRMGNGPETSGDGYNFRGRGWLQDTGRDNYTESAKLTGIDFVGNPDLMAATDGCAESAGAYWESHGCNALMDSDSFSQTVLKINGKLPCDANQGAVRLGRYRDCVVELNKLVS